MPCVFRTPPGVDLLVRGPANLPKDGIAALEGLVESDWIEVPFTVSWNSRPGLPVRFDEGEPFAMVVPQRRLDLEAYRPTVRSLREAPALVETVKRWLARGERQQLRQFAAEHVEGIGGPRMGRLLPARRDRRRWVLRGPSRPSRAAALCRPGLLTVYPSNGPGHVHTPPEANRAWDNATIFSVVGISGAARPHFGGALTSQQSSCRTGM